MRDTEGTVVRLEDYKALGWKPKTTELFFELHDNETLVSTKLSIVRDLNEESSIRLHGENLELVELAVDGRSLSNNEYSVDDEGLTLFDVPKVFDLAIKNRIHPETNTELQGLYKSSALFCTQCEAESFRRITYYPDRPDVLSVFTTTIEADKDAFPVLLSNGNRIAYEELAENRHRAIWHDPHPKPSYLFALVAGDLSSLEDSFTTMSGKSVRLTIYSEPENIGKCAWAMECLKQAMKWDEDVYGREYDLDRFMIVAVSDFNFGAMENKGLNIFNVSALLASADTATDNAFQGIAAVIAHEYFHNWSGNRVTCRDWFQLSLKEGFTVFRDTQFSESIEGQTKKRIETVAGLRAGQFSEDAGKLAHPVRPDQYADITNFYTATIYEKGAEVLRMMYTMAGEKKWRKATDLYFERHDGSAATVEDFVAAVSEATELDLNQFFLWYSQSGTPRLTVEESRREDQLTLTIRQGCSPTPNQPEKKPFHIPIAIGLIDDSGNELLGEEGRKNGHSITCDSPMSIENPNHDGTLILHLKQEESQLTLKGVTSESAVSFLRGFSAPVYVEYSQDFSQLKTLALHDSDGFSRWNSAQELYSEFMLNNSVDIELICDLVEEIARRILSCADKDEEKSILMSALSLPSPMSILQEYPRSDFDAIVANRDRLAFQLSSRLIELWTEILNKHQVDEPYEVSKSQVNRRTARAIALAHIRRAYAEEKPREIGEALAQNFRNADNLTDRLANTTQLLELPDEVQDIKQNVLDEFHDKFAHEQLVINTWFRIQATCTLPGALERVGQLEQHPSFNIKNPNRLRSLIYAFAMGNWKNFHNADGSGYSYIAGKVIEIETWNPHVAARLATELTQWTIFDDGRQQHMKSALGHIEQHLTSKGVRDVVNRGLAD
ncbi:MAG: aminopeptidase N [Gammaproteobacteria bacterium]|nr:aminopeptidase N [Gammaproteobacteria bacterium]